MLQPFILNDFPKASPSNLLKTPEKSNLIGSKDGDVEESSSFKDTLSEKIESKETDKVDKNDSVKVKNTDKSQENKKTSKSTTKDNGELNLDDFSFEELFQLYLDSKIDLDQLNEVLERYSGTEMLETLNKLLEMLELSIPSDEETLKVSNEGKIEVPAELIKIINELEKNIEKGSIDTDRNNFKELILSLMKEVKETIEIVDGNSKNSAKSDEILKNLSEISDILNKINKPKVESNVNKIDENNFRNSEEIKEINSKISKNNGNENIEKTSDSEKEEKTVGERVIKTQVKDVLNVNPVGLENEAKDIKIQVEDLARITPKLTTNVMSQVVNVSKEMISYNDNLNEMVIRLKPEDLGNLTVKMSIKDGVILAEMNVENNVVKEIIESNITDLRNALKDKGYSEINIDVNINKEDSGNNQNARQGLKKSKFSSNEEIVETGSIMDFLEEISFNYLA